MATVTHGHWQHKKSFGCCQSSGERCLYYQRLKIPNYSAYGKPQEVIYYLFIIKKATVSLPYKKFLQNTHYYTQITHITTLHTQTLPVYSNIVVVTSKYNGIRLPILILTLRGDVLTFSTVYYLLLTFFLTRVKIW